MANKQSDLRSIDGLQFRTGFLVGAECLGAYKEKVNALNVFPVPDGDTGTNMFMTMQMANEYAARVRTNHIGEIASELAKGALLGARGNSGVILSQFFSGLSRGLEASETSDSKRMVVAFEKAAEVAYTSVVEPVEGTMLTLFRSIADSARREISKNDIDLLTLFDSVLQESKKALARTPSQLPQLRTAGVVDAGGQGLVILLEGFLRSLTEENGGVFAMRMSVPDADTLELVAGLASEDLMINNDYKYGYCTEFMIEGAALNLQEIRNKCATMGSSVVVVAHEDILKVHIHVSDSKSVLNYAATLGNVTGVKIDNIDEQHQEFRAIHQMDVPTEGISVISVVQGDGFEKLFKELGCDEVILCERTMNPSTASILEASAKTGMRNVVVLPNNSNVIPAAEQAASLSDKQTLHVLPSKNLVEGVSAVLSYSPYVGLEDLIKVMCEAINAVTTIEITNAVETSLLENTDVKYGQFVAFLDGSLVAADDSLDTVLSASISQANVRNIDVVTIYLGKDSVEDEVETITDSLESMFHGVDIESLVGNQIGYRYIISVE